MPNPLAIGVTLGGVLLDIVVPRPKPRVGLAPESSLLSARRLEDTVYEPRGAVRRSADREWLATRPRVA